MHTRKTKKRVSSLSWKRLFIACFFVAGTCLPWMISAKSTENQAVVQQAMTIKGVVQDETGEPLIGVGVMVKGTATGTITDLDGNFSIQTTIGSVLVFSYVGYFNQEIKVESSQSLNVVMKISATEIEEVVVTAMGVKTEKKKLNFAVQNVKAEDILESRSTNFVNALQGKIAGVNVTTFGNGSPNSESQIIIRGISSINPSQKNEPLFILDGIPLNGSGTNMRDINPADIENITVLKGAAAAALYGQDAADGAIMITTKQGKEGTVSIAFDAGLNLSAPMRVPKVQQIYDVGVRGMHKTERDGGSGGWGPLIAEGSPVYNNIKNYYNTGSSLTQQYNLSMTGGSQKFQGYASLNFSDGEGFVVDDYRQQYGLLAKGTFSPSKQVTMNALANIINSSYRGAGTASSVYSWPVTDDIRDYETIDGYPRFRYMNIQKQSSPVSPLFGRYNDFGKNETTRTLLQFSVSYKPIEGLDITGRLGLDQNNYNYDSYEVPRFDDSLILSEDNPLYLTSAALSVNDLEKIEKELLGYYYASYSRNQLYTGTLVATYDFKLSQDLKLGILGGGEIKSIRTISSSLRGRDFVIPGTYSISNTNPKYANLSGRDGGLDLTNTHGERRKGGLFGELRLDYKGLANLSFTSRWDWSSTLVWADMPYYYPSITGGVVFSEIFNLATNYFSYGKIRANWARVGKDTPSMYLFDEKFKSYPTLPDGGYGLDPASSSAIYNDLKPEMTDSWEVGLDLRFFNSRTRLDMAYFSAKVDNQIVTVRVSPSVGKILLTRNEGSLENRGFELSLEQDILKSKDISWTLGVNYSANRGKVVSLPEGISEIQGSQYGDIFTAAYLNGSTTAIIGSDYERTENGEIIINENGTPRIQSAKGVNIGNREPDFLTGISSRFRYRDFTLGFLLDIRKGGDIVNVTRRGMWSSGTAKDLEFYRGRQIVWDGVVQQSDGSYVKNSTPMVLNAETIRDYYTAVSSNFIEDGSFVRLSHVTFTYNLSRLLKKNSPFSDLSFSLTGRNLFVLTKYTGSDPQANASISSGGTGSAGIDNYNAPLARSVNFSVSAKF